MGMLLPPPGVQGPTLDVQVLEGLETYIATEDFLHKLEHAAAEWIDLSEHCPAGKPHDCQSQSAAQGDGTGSQDSPAAEAATAQLPAPASGSEAREHNPSGSSSGRSRSGFFSWRRSSRPGPAPPSCASSSTSAAPAQQESGTSSSATTSSSMELAEQPAAAGTASGAAAAAGDLAASVFEVVEQQPPLHQELAQQEPFVLVSVDDAIEGMAYYIALYLSRAPEARYMEPKQLQAALKQTFTAIRRSRYKVIWDWGRWLYRWGAVSYSALQLYEHPWLVRAVVAAIWTSSKMALGFLA